MDGMDVCRRCGRLNSYSTEYCSCGMKYPCIYGERKEDMPKDGMKEGTKEIIELAMTAGIEIAKMVIDAFLERDPKKLKKVTDVFPRGHALKSRLALAMKDKTL